MVLISHRYKFIYIKNVKVGGTSVESFFGQFCVDPKKTYNFPHKQKAKISKFGIIGCRAVNIKNTKWKPHASATKIMKKMKNMNMGNKFNKYTKFCVVRNPYDVEVSKYYWYNRKKKKDDGTYSISFKDWVRKVKNANTNFRIFSINGKSVCDYYIRYENLQEDIIKLCKILNITDYNINDLPSLKSNVRDKEKHYSEFYDEETRKIVYEKYKKEFDLFGYKFEKQEENK